MRFGSAWGSVGKYSPVYISFVDLDKDVTSNGNLFTVKFKVKTPITNEGVRVEVTPNEYGNFTHKKLERDENGLLREKNRFYENLNYKTLGITLTKNPESVEINRSYENNMTIKASSVEYFKSFGDDCVSVTFNVVNNIGLASIMLKVEFDETYLQVLDVYGGSVFPKGKMSWGNLSWYFDSNVENRLLVLEGKGFTPDCIEGEEHPWHLWRSEGDCSLLIKGNIEVVGEYCFCGDYNIKSVYLGESIETIKKGAFKNTGIKNIIIPENVYEVREEALIVDGGLEDLWLLKDTVKLRSGSYIMKDDAHKKVSELEMTIGSDCRAYRIDNSLYVFGRGKTVDHYETLGYEDWKKELENYDTIIIGAEIDCIGSMLFEGMKTLKSVVVIGNSLKRVESKAFYRCSNLESLTNFDFVDYVGSRAFDDTKIVDVSSDVIIGRCLYSCGKDFNETYYCVDEDVVQICSYAFKDVESLKLIDFKNVQRIENFAFERCRGLKRIVISDSVCHIGAESFKDCTSALDVVIGYNAQAETYALGYEYIQNFRKLQGIRIFVMRGSKIIEYLEKYGFEYTVIDKYTFNIKFVADGALVYETTFGVLDLELDYIPEVPEKDMYYASWEDFVLRPEDMVVNAVYVAMNPAEFLIYEDLNTYSRVIGMSRDCTGTLNIPMYHNGLPVKELGYEAFKYRSLEVVNIPNTVTKVGNECFYGCNKLHEVSGFDWVRVLGERAFANSKIESFVVSGDRLEEVGESTFYCCDKLIYAYLGNSLTSLSSYMFYGCKSLQNFNIPDKVTVLPDYIFSYCSSLSNISLKGIVGLGAYCFGDCVTLTTLDDCEDVSSIGSYAFQHCNLREVVFPKVGYLPCCFWECKNLVKATFGEELISGVHAFVRCESLETFEGKLKVAGLGFFSGCTKLRNIDFSYITEIHANAFYNCKSLSGEIVMPNIVTIVDMYNCEGIESLVLGDESGTQNIDISGITGCSSLKSVYVKTAGNVTVSSKTKKISSSGYEYTGCFQDNASLNIVDIKAGGKITLGVNSFIRCVGMLSLSLDVGVSGNTISKSSFEGCISLKSVELRGGFVLYERAFYGCSSLGNVDLSGVSEIGEDCFYRCYSLETVILEMPVVIKNYAFYNCTSLKSVYNNRYVKTIGSGAFSGCEALSDFDIRGVTSIGDYAFRGCKSMKNLIADESLAIIEDNAFEGSGLVSVNLSGSSVTKLGKFNKNFGYVFRHCESLEEVLLPESLTDIHGYCFEFCTSLKKVNIPENVVYIGKNCFAYSGVEELVLGKNLKEIGTEIVLGCENLKVLELKSDYFLTKAAYNDRVCYIENPYFTTLKLTSTKSGYFYIDRLLFRNCDNLRNIEGLDRVVYFRQNAFRESPVILDSWNPNRTVVTLCAGCLLNATHSGVLKFTNRRVSVYDGAEVPVFGPGVSKVFIGFNTNASCYYGVGPTFDPETRIAAPDSVNDLFVGLKTENTLIYKGSLTKNVGGVDNTFEWHIMIDESDCERWLSLSGDSNKLECSLGASLFVLEGDGVAFNNSNSVGTWSVDNIGSSCCLGDYYASKLKSNNYESTYDYRSASLLVLKNIDNTTTIPSNAIEDMWGIKVLYDDSFDENDADNNIYSVVSGEKKFLGAGYLEGDLSGLSSSQFLRLGSASFKNTYCYQIKELIRKTVYFEDCCLYSEGLYDEYNSPCDENGNMVLSSSLNDIGDCSLKGFVGVRNAVLDGSSSGEIYVTVENGLVYRNGSENEYKKLLYVPDSWGSEGCSVLLGSYDEPCDFVGGVFSVNQNIRFITVSSDRIEVSSNKLNGILGTSVLRSRILAFEESLTDLDRIESDGSVQVIVNGRNLIESDSSTPLWTLYIYKNKNDSYLKIESVGDNNSTPDYIDDKSNLAFILNGATNIGPKLTEKIDTVKIYINNGSKEWTFGSYFWYDMRVVNSSVLGREVSFDDICEFYVRDSSGNFSRVKSVDMTLNLNSYSMAGLAFRRDGSGIGGIELGNCTMVDDKSFKTRIHLNDSFYDSFDNSERGIYWKDLDLNAEKCGKFYISFMKGKSSDSIIYAYGSYQVGYAAYETVSTYSDYASEETVANAHTVVCWKSGDALVVGVPTIFGESDNGRNTSNVLMFRGNKIKSNDLLIISNTGSIVSMNNVSEYPDWDSGILRRTDGSYGNIIIDSKIQSIGTRCFYGFLFGGILFKEVVAENGSVVGCTTIKNDAFGSNSTRHALSGNIRLPKSLSHLDIHAFYNMPENGLLIWVYGGAVTYRSGVDVTWWTTEVKNFENSGLSVMAFNTYGKSNTVNGIRVKKDNTNKGLYWYLRYRFVHDKEITDNFDGDNYWKVMSINGFVKGSKNVYDSESEWSNYIDRDTGNNRILATDIEWAEMEEEENERWSDYL